MENVILRCKLEEIMDRSKSVSVNKLAVDINERRSTINDLKNNKEMASKRIPASLIAKLCVYFNVTLDDLFEVVRLDTDK